MGGSDESSGVIRSGSEYMQSLASPAPSSPVAPSPAPSSVVSGDDDVSTSSSTKDSPREMRNKAEKQRRDKMNESIAHLATIVPPVAIPARKIDKISKLRLTAHYLRSHQYVFGDTIDTKTKCNRFSVEFTKTLLRTLKGFLIALTYKGLVVVVSPNIQEYLGYSELELLGQSIYSYVHEHDHALLREQLMPQNTMLGSNGELLIPEDPEGKKRIAEELRNERRSFIIRFKKLNQQRSGPVHYVTCHVEGTLRMADKACPKYNRVCQIVRRARFRGENPTSSGNDVVFIGMARPTTETFMTEGVLESFKLEYRTRHSIDGEIIQCEQRIALVTGYMTHEVSGMNAMNFMHRDDVRWVIFALREMYVQNRIFGESCYRLMTKNGRFIYMRTRGRLDVDKNTNAVTSFVCTNTVVNEDEGKQLIRLMKKRFKILVNNGDDKDTDEDEASQEVNEKNISVEDPEQLQEVILHLVTNLPSQDDLDSDVTSPSSSDNTTPRLSIIPPKKDRIVKAILKSTFVIGNSSIPNMAHRRRRDAYSEGRPEHNTNINRPITRSYAQSVNNINAVFAVTLPSSREQYSWNTTQAEGTSFNHSIFVDTSTSSRASRIRVTSTVTRATRNRASASIARSEISRTTSTTTSPSVCVNTSSATHLTANDTTSTVNQSTIGGVTASVTVTAINHTTSSASAPNFDGITSTVSILTNNAITSIIRNSWLTWPRATIITPISSHVASSYSGSSIINSESTTTQSSSVNQTIPPATEVTSQMFQSSSATTQPDSQIDETTSASLETNPFVIETPYVTTEAAANTIQPFALMWQPFPSVNQTVVTTVRTTSTVTHTNANIARLLTFTTADPTRTTFSAPTVLTPLNQYVFHSTPVEKSTPNKNAPTKEPNNAASVEDQNEAIVPEISSRRVTWAIITTSDSSDSSSYLRFTAKRNDDPTVTPIAKKVRSHRKPSKESPQPSALSHEIYEYKDESFEVDDDGNQPSYGKSYRRDKLRPFRSVSQTPPEDPAEPQPGPSGICGVRRSHEDTEEEPPSKILKNEDIYSEDSLLEALRLDADEQIKISEIDANGIDYKNVLEEAKRDKSSYFEDFL